MNDAFHVKDSKALSRSRGQPASQVSCLDIRHKTGQVAEPAIRSFLAAKALRGYIFPCRPQELATRRSPWPSGVSQKLTSLRLRGGADASCTSADLRCATVTPCLTVTFH